MQQIQKFRISQYKMQLLNYNSTQHQEIFVIGDSSTTTNWSASTIIAPRQVQRRQNRRTPLKLNVHTLPFADHVRKLQILLLAKVYICCSC